MSDIDPMAGSALPMTMEEYEQLAARTLNLALTRDQRLLDAAAGLAEEAGELLGLVRKHLFMGHAIDVARVTIELGDALWCLTTAAGALGVPLERVAAANIAKLRKRYPEGYSDAKSVERDV
jgi:NTP pyrophosphatase (non-canonical NTP hydrolase)